MSFWEILILAFVLGIDAFSVALAVGTGGSTFRQTFRLSFHFGLFQFLMPIVGWLLGRNIVSLVQRYDHWVAFGLLFVIGVRMIYEAFRHRPEKATVDRTRRWSLVALSTATSIDALGAGVGMGILNTSLIYPCTIIGLTAAAMTLTGIKLGSVISAIIGSRMEAIGGVVLILLSLKMLTI
jgi:putative Mn2+ efflux pump MntP